jgi:hypothetical protein
MLTTAYPHLPSPTAGRVHPGPLPATCISRPLQPATPAAGPPPVLPPVANWRPHRHQPGNGWRGKTASPAKRWSGRPPAGNAGPAESQRAKLTLRSTKASCYDSARLRPPHVPASQRLACRRYGTRSGRRRRWRNPAASPSAAARSWLTTADSRGDLRADIARTRRAGQWPASARHLAREAGPRPGRCRVPMLTPGDGHAYALKVWVLAGLGVELGELQVVLPDVPGRWACARAQGAGTRHRRFGLRRLAI